MSILTHNQSFHCDEVCAYAILNYLHPGHTLYRTRSEKALEKATFVIDVGGIYDPEKNRFDHHQDDFKESFFENGFIPMSSAGLVWKHYGKKFLKKYNKKLNDEQIKKVYYSFYRKFIQEIDAHDNGVRQCDKEKEHKYHKQTVLGSLVSDMNGINTNNEHSQMENFKSAATFVFISMTIKLDSIIKRLMAYDDDKKVIVKAFEKTFGLGQIIYINKNCTNWLRCIHEYEKNNKIEGIVKFVIYKVDGKKDSEFRVKTLEKERFEPRKKLESETYLRSVLKNPDEMKFVHKALFIGSATTFETALEMALLSLK